MSAIDNMIAKDPDLTPAAALVVLMTLARGGEARADMLVCDVEDWIDQYGVPTFESLRRWENDSQEQIDIGLAAAAAMWERQREKRRRRRHCGAISLSTGRGRKSKPLS